MTDLRLATFFAIMVVAWTFLEISCVYAVYSSFCDPDRGSRRVDGDFDCATCLKSEFDEVKAFLSAYQAFN